MVVFDSNNVVINVVVDIFSSVLSSTKVSQNRVTKIKYEIGRVMKNKRPS